MVRASSSKHNHHTSVSRSVANDLKAIVDFVERNSLHDRRPPDSLGHPIDRTLRVLTRAVPRTDDFNLALRDLDRVDRRKFRLFTNDDDLPATHDASGCGPHRGGDTNAFENTSRSQATGEFDRRSSRRFIVDSDHEV